MSYTEQEARDWCRLLLLGHKRDWKVLYVIAEWYSLHRCAEVDWKDAIAVCQELPMGIGPDMLGGKVGRWLACRYPRMSRWMLHAWGIQEMPDEKIIDVMITSPEAPVNENKRDDSAIRAARTAARQAKILLQDSDKRVAAHLEGRSRSEQWGITKPSKSRTRRARR